MSGIGEPEFLLSEEVKDFVKTVSHNIDKIWRPLADDLENKIVELWDYALKCARYEVQIEIDAAYKRGREDAAKAVAELMVAHPFVFPTDTATVEATIAAVRGGEQ